MTEPKPPVTESFKMGAAMAMLWLGESLR